MKILQTEFIKKYCEKSNMTEKEINDLGLFALPCDCERKGCQGWMMITKENLKAHMNMDMSYEKSL